MFMHHFMTSYAMYFNRRHKRVGRVFQSSFQSKRLPKIIDLGNTKEYLRKNPYDLDAKIVRKRYRWLYISKRY